LAFDDSGRAGEPFHQAAQSLGMPLDIVHDSFTGGREAYESRLVLVRPDQYVVWTGDQAPADPAALLRKVTGIA
jgi:hypothetical protein